MKRKKKLTNRRIIYIIVSAVACLAVAAVLIVNIFIPVKYLSAYVNFKKSVVPADAARVTFIDVGNGDCTLLELPDGKTALIDAGDGRRSNELKILKTLNSRNINRIDYLICSSVADYRCGGLAEIIKYKSIGKIFAPYCVVTEVNEEYRKFRTAADNAEKTGAEKAYCEIGENISGDNFTLCFLSPSQHDTEGGECEQLNQSPKEDNVFNASAVIWLEVCGVKFLFLGDGLKSVEEKIYKILSVQNSLIIGEREINLTKCDVLKVGNHGMKTSVYSPLYEYLKPKAAVISVGSKNARGCPSLDALAAAQNNADELYRTDRDGSVEFYIKDGAFNVIKEKV